MAKSATKSTSARMLFADRIRTLRVERSLTQEALAELAGLHRTYVGSVERGERNISIDNMEKLARALGVTIKKLVDDEAAE